MEQPLTIAVLISGNGSNLQALIDAIAAGLPAQINVVISNREQAYGLERAKQAGIATEIIAHSDYPDRRSYDKALQACIERYQPQLILLAGFMRILSPEFVQHFRSKIINIHPSLLPKYPGLNTHEAVLAAGDTQHGATVHLVTEELDSGPILAWASLAITRQDDVASVKQKVHSLEHKLYPFVLGLWAEGRLQILSDHIQFDDKPLPQGGLKLEVP